MKFRYHKHDYIHIIILIQNNNTKIHYMMNTYQTNSKKLVRHPLFLTFIQSNIRNYREQTLKSPIHCLNPLPPQIPSIVACANVETQRKDPKSSVSAKLIFSHTYSLSKSNGWYLTSSTTFNLNRWLLRAYEGWLLCLNAFVLWGLSPTMRRCFVVEF